ncbi:unnamed protein product [Dicrocoelium dendriticum]|nr:unnamed protein product [Dicrocoelium dendriticum]
MRPVMPRRTVRESPTSPHSGLTMNVTHANLPTVPLLVPHYPTTAPFATLSSFVGQETSDSTYIKEDSESSATPGVNQRLEDVLSPLLNAVVSSSEPSSRCNTRPRYVLPPGTVTAARYSAHEATPGISQIPMQTSWPVSNEPLGSGSLGSEASSPVTPATSDPLPTPVTQSLSSTSYEPISGVWFYATNLNGSKIWWPFSRHDSSRLESMAHDANLLVPSRSESFTACLLPVEGGRYDVNLGLRERHSVYWDEPVTEVRRATWFYRSPDENRVLPFSEAVCEQLEGHFRDVVQHGLWGQRFEMPSEDPRGGTDYFIFHSPQSIIQFRAWPYSYGSITERSDASETLASADDTDSYSKVHPSISVSEHDGRLYHVRRGLDAPLMEQLEDGEFLPIDHVYFVVHGIGSVYNLKGQGLIECVNNLRRTARQVARSHFAHHGHRVEFLPILWHDELHSDATGVDSQLNQITLRSIPKLRQFTNGTLMDILFYTSSRYCQVIVDTVAKEMCRLRNLFLSRNPNYSGGFSIIGHSLGAVIVFDLLAHQNLPLRSSSDELTIPESADTNGTRLDVEHTTRPPDSSISDESGRSSSSLGAAGEMEGWSLVGHRAKHKPPESETTVVTKSSSDSLQSSGAATNPEITKLIDLLSRAGLAENKISQVVDSWFGDGVLSVVPPDRSTDASTLVHNPFWLDHQQETMSAGFGMPVVVYPQLGFPLTTFFMLGSPLALFLTARGVRQLPSHYHLPSCPLVFNIFHPFDPVAYRMETLIEPTFQARAVLMPHHKGRKRLHLQLRDNLARVGSDLRAKLYQSVQATWRTLQEFARSHRIRGNQTDPSQDVAGDDDGAANTFSKELSQMDSQPGDREDVGSYFSEGDMTFSSQLNKCKRIDFVLQEAPLESFSDYLFALGSHAAYWESKDTSLFLLTETYAVQSVTPVTSEPQSSDEVPVPSLLPASGDAVSSIQPLPPLAACFPTSVPLLCPMPPAPDDPMALTTSCDASPRSLPIADDSEMPVASGQLTDTVLLQPAPMDPLYTKFHGEHVDSSGLSHEDLPISDDASQHPMDTRIPHALPPSTSQSYQHGPQYPDLAHNPAVYKPPLSVATYPTLASVSEPPVGLTILHSSNPLDVCRYTWSGPYLPTPAPSITPSYPTQYHLTSSIPPPLSNPSSFPIPPPPPPPPLPFSFAPGSLPFPPPRYAFRPP